MLGIQTSPNSVYISTVETGCCKAKFDSTYPIHLTLIISLDEFQESINKINNASTSKNKTFTILAILFVVSMVGGMTAAIVAVITGTTKISKVIFSPLFIAGIAVIVVGTIPTAIGFCIAQSRHPMRLQQAITEESKKYSSCGQAINKY